MKFTLGNLNLRLITKKHGGLLILLFWLIIPLFNYSNLVFLVHDNLDSNVSWILNLIRSGKLFAPATANLDHIFNGIPRFCFQSEYFLYLWFYQIFEPKLAYLLHYMFLHLIGYIGMYLFLLNYVLDDSSKKFATWIALCFALLPFWPTGSLSIAGIPLFVFSILNIGQLKKVKVSLALILLYLLGSSFFFAPLWVIVGIGVWWLTQYTSENSKKGWWIMGTVLFLSLMIGVLIEWRLFYNQFGLKIPSHRIMWNAVELNLINWKGWLGISLRHFLFGHYHFHSLHILVAAVGVVWIGFVLVVKKSVSTALLLILVIACVSLIGVGQDLGFYKELVKNTPLNGLNLRFFVFTPFLWYLFLAVIVKEILKLQPQWILGVKAALGLQIVLLSFGFINKDFFGSKYSENIFSNNIMKFQPDEQVDWEDYFLENEKAAIYDIIPLNERVACINFVPERLQYLGYKTVGAYQFFIPLESKKEFNELMPYLNLKKLTAWGSTSFLEIQNNSKSEQLNWNKLAVNYGINYILSSRELNLTNLTQIYCYSGIYIYQLKISK